MTTYRRYESPFFEVKALIHDGTVHLRWHDRLAVAPVALPVGAALADKVEGMLLGLAIGDALGNTSESLLPQQRIDRFGIISDYLGNAHADGAAVGLPSDDTQLAFWTLEHLLNEGHLEPQVLGIAFSHRKIYGLCRSVREFLSNFKTGVPWMHAGAMSAGNGALMRMAPLLLPHLSHPSENLWADALMAAHLTHRDALSNVCCLAFVDLLWRLLGLPHAPQPSWWVDTFCEFCVDIDPGKAYAPRAGHPDGFNGTISELLRQYVEPALQDDLPVIHAAAIWHSGAYLLETMPTVLYILARHGHDPMAAILQAVNYTKDNDTIAAIVGAAMGALYGRSALPSSWLDGLAGRTGADDDGQIYRLMAQAGMQFGYGVSPWLLSRSAESTNSQTQTSKVEFPAWLHQGVTVHIHSSSYWVKVTGNLQQNWAAIDNRPAGGVRIWFFDDNSGVFDLIDLPSWALARSALALNGFEVWTSGKYGFIGRPKPDFKWHGHPNGLIYSSRRYWIG